MARFSVSGAATSGFGVIGREPLAVLAWGLLILVVLVVPFGALCWTLIPDFIDLVKSNAANMEAGGAGPAAMAQMMRIQSKMMLFNAVYLVGGTLVKAMIAAAVFRVVLEPARKGFAFLKLGAQELWLALVYLVMGVLAYMVVLAAAVAVGILAALAYVIGAVSSPQAAVAACILVAVLAGIGATGGVIWAMLRLSMAGPMSFSERKFLLFESWSLTRGQSLPLLGMALLLGLILIALETVVYGVLGVGFLAFGRDLIARFAALEGQPPQAWLQALWPFAAGVAVVGSLLSAPAMALVYAPWATAYRDLGGSTSQPAAEPSA
jgi:hypothetical protein